MTVRVVEASTSEEPDNWIPVVNHQFLTHDEAANSKFKDQVQIFTKRELNPETIKMKFDRVKVTCMQSANPRELFGLEFIVLKTEVTVDLGLDVFGRFKLKEKNDDEVDEFKEQYLKLFGKKKTYKDELKEKITETGLSNFAKKQEQDREHKKKPLLEKLESKAKLNATGSGIPSSSTDTSGITNNLPDMKRNKNEPPVARTLFGDVIPSPKPKKKPTDTSKTDKDESMNLKKRVLSPQPSSSDDSGPTKKARCSLCNFNDDELCKNCNLPKVKPLVENIKTKPRKKTKPKKEFNKLFEDISFSLSGYVNPQRDEIRRKALKMGAKYIADPNITSNKCTHLICAFKNTPKSQQLKGHCKIVGHKFIENCFDKKKRLPWRRYALDSREQSQPESEEEIEGSTSPIRIPSIYDQETDDSD
ncbi:DNA repair protein XRCC1 isoform X2 [Nasonia vitripennis]|uniref:BRCT domain-containing protein n=1 Tax=Nasonia vitripennis TaxID=7425 RepID=A0A7M7HCH9_NASVI|nr:DNA repair protein XRCC1 isoform X2 [Nasonia vitripennis]